VCGRITDAARQAWWLYRVMSRGGHLWACAVGFVALALGGPSLAGAAALKPITGRLDKPGYTVIALAANGQAGSVIAQGGSFSVVPPAATVTLQLRAPDGIYAGPIVLAQGDNVKQALAEVATAARGVTLAKKNVTNAQKTLKKARTKQAKGKATRQLKQAKQQLTKADLQLRKAKLLLTEAQRQADPVKQALAEVATAARGVTLAKKNITNAQKTLKKARTKQAKGKATTQLKQAKQQLTKANLQLRKANLLLTQAQTQAAERVKWAVVGAKAGASLGAVTVNSGAGYALAGGLSAQVWRTGVDTTRWARANNGVPIGAGNFGRVLSNPPPVSPPGDLDADGIPDVLDVDINGNLILNNVDRSSTGLASAAQVPPAPPPTNQFKISTVLALDLPLTLNADATTVTQAQIDNTLVHNQTVVIEMKSANPELDCGGAPDPSNPLGWLGGLSYCTRGGTGTVLPPGPPSPTAQYMSFPACCDPDGNGFGTLFNNAPNLAASPGAFFFKPGATTSQIGTGDVMIQKVTTNGVESDFTSMVPYVFATVPAMVSYNDGQGNATTIPYPVPPAPGLGTLPDPYPVTAGPSGHVVLSLSFWRPQRKPIPPETSAWTDIGKLSYTAQIPHLGSQNISQINHSCPASAYSTTDPNLVVQDVPQFVAGAGGVVDQAPDQPASPANTFSYTLDLTACLAARGLTWHPGEAASVVFGSWGNTAGTDVAETSVAFALH
jgi:hypothetical protein